jgi:ferredoxin
VTFIVTDACVKCKLMDCIEVCPVDCFFEGENFLVIDPEECIDCGVCEPECPLEAIKPDTEDTADQFWLSVNSKYSRVWPNITRKGVSPIDADEFRTKENKFEKYFSVKPGNSG